MGHNKGSQELHWCLLQHSDSDCQACFGKISSPPSWSIFWTPTCHIAKYMWQNNLGSHWQFFPSYYSLESLGSRSVVNPRNPSGEAAQRATHQHRSKAGQGEEWAVPQRDLLLLCPSPNNLLKFSLLESRWFSNLVRQKKATDSRNGVPLLILASVS